MRIWVNTVFILTSPKTEIARSVRGPKLQGPHCRRRNGGVVLRAENFGDLMTADHKVLSEGCESRNNHRHAVVVQDLATQWIQSYPCKTKTSQETQRCLQKFLEPTRKPKVIYTDNFLEFGKACEDLSWNHCHSLSRPDCNNTADVPSFTLRAALSAIPFVSDLCGVDAWVDSMECYCYLRNIQDLLSDGKTPYERRFGMPFNGPVLPFGAMVECHTTSAKDTSRLHQVGPRVLPGIFLGCALYAERIWKGYLLIADVEELAQMDASELHARRLNAKEVLSPMKGDNFIFPVADGIVKIFGGDQRLRTSTLIRDRPERGEEQEVLRGKSDGLSSPTPLQDDFALDDAEAKNDFWSATGGFICRHHVEPRVKLYVPREESFPIPLKYIDVSSTTHTNLDVMQESRIDDYWNIDGSRDLSVS